LLTAYALVWMRASFDPALLRNLWFLPGIGVIAAIIANTSGTGGGVVFVSMFNALREWRVMDLQPLQVVGVSMAILSFGMTMGALRWTDRLFHQPPPDRLNAAVNPCDFFTVVGTVLALSLPALLLTQRATAFDQHAVLMSYKVFSIMLGLALIATTWTVNRQRVENARLAKGDLAVLLLCAVLGRDRRTGRAVSLHPPLSRPAMHRSGLCDLVDKHDRWKRLAYRGGTIAWEVVLLAAPGAMLGGFLARPIALWLGARRLKTLDGTWIVLSACYLLWLSR